MGSITQAQAQTLREQITIRLSEPFGRRAVELANTAHLTGTPRLIEIRQRTILFSVPSKNRLQSYAVVADYAGSIWCECMAAQHDRACCHVGAVSLYLKVMAQACTAYAS